MSFFRKKPNVNGLLGYFGLGKWWLDTFTEGERKQIEQVYQPFTIGSNESRPLTEGKIASTDQTPAALLSSVATWLTQPEEFDLARQLLEKAEATLTSDMVEAHFVFANTIDVFHKAYRNEKCDREKLIDACKKQIAIAPNVAAEFKKQYTVEEAEKAFGARLPAHTGYHLLFMLKEKAEEYDEAIQLAKEAQAGEWGDNTTRILRCQLKQARPKDKIPTCPYCDIELQKRPKRKTKCQSCGESMYVRQGYLIKEDEIEFFTYP